MEHSSQNQLLIEKRLLQSQLASSSNPNKQNTQILLAKAQSQIRKFDRYQINLLKRKQDTN